MASTDGACPVARVDDLIVTESGNELLVFDTRNDALHHLNPLASIIWRSCDGANDLRRIQAICSERIARAVSEEEVEDGLQKLADQDLMQGTSGGSGTLGQRSSRRKAIKRTTMMGAAIASVTVPLASAHASSGTSACVPAGGACSSVDECCDKRFGCTPPPVRGASPTCGGV